MKILTIGSLNMDTLFITERLPKIGETVLSRSYSMNPGGKGANQAVAVSKLGAESLLAGRVGDDALGKRLLQKLKKEKVNVHHVLKDEEYPTGTAFITVDEIPQICNVLSGEMSLVGPRPISVDDTAFFEVPGFPLRHKVKPGITGWAQVHGLRGGRVEPEERIRYDLYYIEEWSLWLDMAILFISPFAFTNAY
jgi:sugar/nucleoside kinase (ribokinase family)